MTPNIFFNENIQSLQLQKCPQIIFKVLSSTMKKYLQMGVSQFLFIVPKHNIQGYLMMTSTIHYRLQGCLQFCPQEILILSKICYPKNSPIIRRILQGMFQIFKDPS